MDKFENIELEAMIKDVAEKLNIAPYPVAEVKRKVKEYYESPIAVIRKLWYSNYIKECIVWSLNDIRKENSIENQMYLELERCKKTGELTEAEIAENDRISKVVEMLSAEEFFPLKQDMYVSLHKALQWLTSDQCGQVRDYILILKDYCDAIGICSILESADINETKKKILLRDTSESDLSENEKQYQPATFVRRLELMTKYIRETANKKISETETFGTRHWLQSTGSDPHCKGRLALFLVNKSKNEIEYVYKPHDLSADNAVVGEDGMLAQINKFFKENYLLKGTPIEGQDAFATVHIDPEKHLETYVKKLHTMDKEKAKEYFYKAGMLQVITDAMAVTDLHQDNIMPTEDGPLIIDAEVDFFRTNFSGLLSALTWPDSDEYPRNACFSIDEGNGKILRSGVAFQNEKSTYRTEYREGQAFMLGVINDNIEVLLEEFNKQLQRVTKARILPMSTQVLSDHLQRSMKLNRRLTYKYIPSLEIRNIVDEKSDIGELASVIINDIIEKFADTEECYIFTEKVGVYLDGNEFMESIVETFENGTIISMYIDMDGNIYLDDKVIGYLYDLSYSSDESIEFSRTETNIVTHITADGNIYIYDDKKWKLREPGDKSDERTELPMQLSEDKVIKMIKDHFVYKIKNYTNLNGD